MTNLFGSLYAATYDAVYGEKDYEDECDLIATLFERYGAARVQDVLDLGCGTGNHAFPLAARGYDVVGIDLSEGMLARAREKGSLLPDGRAPTFHLGDIRSVRLDRPFDAILILFAVLGYQNGNADSLAALRTARSHLRPGGLLIFDVWYGPAVLAERPAQRLKLIDTGGRGRMLRASTGELDALRQVCHVDIRLWQLEGDRLTAETEERHTMRFFFPLELELLLEAAGFSLLRLGGFPDIGRDPDETTWNVLAIARAN